MKAGLIVLVMVVLGVGEYAFVEYYPLSPQRRTQKFQKLPVVRSFVKATELREIRRAIEESDSGFVSVYRGGMYRKWSDAEQLYADYKSRATLASTMMTFIKHRDELNASRQKTRDAAEEGDPSAMVQLYFIGKSQTGETDMARAVELLEAHESAQARWYLHINILKTVEMDSREGMLLQARAMKDFYRPPGIGDALVAKMIKQQEEWLSNLRKAAADGDQDSQWVVEQLIFEDPTKIRTESGELEPAFMLEMAKHAVFDLKAHFSVGDEQIQAEYKNGIPGPDGVSYYPPTMKLYFYHKEAGHPDSVTREYMYMVTDAALSSAFWAFMNDEQKAKVRAERERIASETAALARAGDERALWVREKIMEDRYGLDIMEKF